MALRSLAEIYARRPKRYTPTRDGRSAGTVPAVPDTDSRSARSTGVVQPPRENEPATAGDQRSQDDASTDSSQGPFRHTDHPLRQVRITDMSLWDREAIDLLGPAFIEFRGNRGQFRFIAVDGWMDCRHGRRNGRPSVDFTWDGNDEGDPASGRGSVLLRQDGSLTGHI